VSNNQPNSKFRRFAALKLCCPSSRKFAKSSYLHSLTPSTDIDLTVLTSFNRLKEMTEDIAVIADAVADSTVVQLSADKKKIRRAKPLPLTDDTPSRTVYMVRAYRAESLLSVRRHFSPCAHHAFCRRASPLTALWTS